MLRRLILAAFLMPLAAVSSAALAQTESSIDNPIPMGTAATVGDYTVTVTEYTPDASGEIVARHEDNVPPEEGYVYALISFEVTYEGEDVGKASSLQWQFVGSQRSSLTDTSCTSPERTLASGTIDNAAQNADIFPGGSVQYEQCVYLAAEDAENVIMYVQTAEGERVFFELAATMSDATPAASPEASQLRGLA